MKNASEKKYNLKVKKSQAGLGLFAEKDFRKKDFVIEYTGEKISSTEADLRGGKYLFTLNSRWTIDGRERKNISRYINHSCKPNCEAVIEGGKIKICAIKNIKPEQELTYNYGREYFNEFIKPHGCRCEKCNKK